MPARGLRHVKLPEYKKIGAWGWDDARLWSKIEVSLDQNECWPWQGAMSPSGALMGAFKNNIQQRK
jgi:hypothetical protein